MLSARHMRECTVIIPSPETRAWNTWPATWTDNGLANNAEEKATGNYVSSRCPPSRRRRHLPQGLPILSTFLANASPSLSFRIPHLVPVGEPLCPFPGNNNPRHPPIHPFSAVFSFVCTQNAHTLSARSSFLPFVRLPASEQQETGIEIGGPKFGSPKK